MLRAQVEKTIEVIRPALQADGGDIVLHDVDEETGVVTVELTGACVGCPASTQTLKAGIERIMRDRVDGVTEVVDVGDVGAEATALTAPAPTRYAARRRALRRRRAPAIVPPGPPAVADRAGRRRRPGGRAAGRPAAGAAYTVGPHRRARRRQVDADERGDRPAARRRRTGGRAGDRPVVAVHRRGDPRRPGAHAGPRHRRRGVHPLDGHPWPPRRPGARHARGGAAARRRRAPAGAGGDGRRRPGRGGGGRQGRHDRRGRQPGMGRQRPGQQGRADGDRRRLRHQQGRPGRRRRDPARPGQMLELSAPLAATVGGRRSCRRWRRRAMASSICGPRSPPPRPTSRRRASWSAAPPGPRGAAQIVARRLELRARAIWGDATCGRGSPAAPSTPARPTLVRRRPPASARHGTASPGSSGPVRDPSTASAVDRAGQPASGGELLDRRRRTPRRSASARARARSAGRRCRRGDERERDRGHRDGADAMMWSPTARGAVVTTGGVQAGAAAADDVERLVLREARRAGGDGRPRHAETRRPRRRAAMAAIDRGGTRLAHRRRRAPRPTSHHGALAAQPASTLRETPTAAGLRTDATPCCSGIRGKRAAGRRGAARRPCPNGGKRRRSPPSGCDAGPSGRRREWPPCTSCSPSTGVTTASPSSPCANGKVNALSGALLAEIEAAAASWRRPPRRRRGHRRRAIFAAGADISEFGGQDGGRVDPRRSTARSTRSPRSTASSSPPWPATRSAAAASWRWRATTESPERARCSASPRSCSASSRAAAARSGSPGLVGAEPGQGAVPHRSPGEGRRGAGDRARRRAVDGDPHERALALAAEVASGPLAAQAITKRVIDRGLSLPLADGLALERDAFVEVFGTEDAASAWPASSSTAPARPRSPAADSGSGRRGTRDSTSKIMRHEISHPENRQAQVHAILVPDSCTNRLEHAR